ncbi:DEAD/DEAH box helicase [Limnoraphis robusta]|uniref:ATP-binding domain-containing protein n=1 Tax=Limnoraphis robusta CCNP1315 TaxID=3110306 RepID=A0ABU5TZK3_9CYAN|nr:ATP-binding domain-containing protein [Limnoraphis robusta]MEA5520264.1 ATP-binding domain-containing protein [Limnoraphis robusta CCNP1315]MEA5548530.1 ATP-binding domain-containing protein [Limnoraphis robusta CCNP1324]
MVHVIRGTLDKPESSRRLAEYFESKSNIDGSLYLGYPIIGTSQGGYPIDALLISREHGVIIFNIIEGTSIDKNIEEVQDESFNKLQSKLLQQKSLTQRRNLMVDIGVLTFAPALNQKPSDISDEYPIVTKTDELDEYLNHQTWKNGNEYFEKLNSVIQAITTIRKKKSRNNIKTENSRGAKLQKLEDSIANLDRNQSEAVIETVEGVQRIRGLAGSGKTIVLALKVAYLHAKHPDWNIAVTFNTRSLKNQFKQLINIFTIEHTNEEPDWDRVKIIHAWGSPSSEGIYYEVCKRHNIEYRDFNTARNLTNLSGKEFDYVCEEALQKINKFNPYYDAIMIDEAQDFSRYFLRLCYQMLKPPKRLVYAYDELQNLNQKVMESPEVLFGEDSQGKPYVQLQNIPGEPKQDIILKKCYRNSSRPLLSSAHALGFGIYRDQGLIQMFEYAGLWRDIGYVVEDGTLEDGKFVKLARTSDTSPKFLEDHSPIDDLIIFKSFKDKREQTQWLVEQIEKNLTEDELRYDDIMVIHPDPQTTKFAVGEPRASLFEKGINSNLAGVTTSLDDFFSEQAITFTSIHRAKGNEAAMIYVIDAHECYSGSDLAQKRNILFTAMTRSKAWLRVLGYGESMQNLENEFNQVKNRKFMLEFKYPTEEERKQMNLINRDMSRKERAKLDQRKNSLQEVIEAVKKGEIKKEDLSPDMIESLKNILGND